MFNRDDFPALHGVTYKIHTPCGNMYITINRDAQNKIIEVFAKLGKAGGCPTCQVDAQARLISIALQEGANIERLIKQLIGNKCSMSGAELPDEGISCPDAIGKILKKEYEREVK